MDLHSLLKKIINKQKTSLEHFESFESHQKIVNIMRFIKKKLSFPLFGSSASLRLIVWFSGIVGVTECCIRTQQGYLTLGLQCRIGHGAVAFGKIIPHHASQGNEIKVKDIDDCRHIAL